MEDAGFDLLSDLCKAVSTTVFVFVRWRDHLKHAHFILRTSMRTFSYNYTHRLQYGEVCLLMCSSESLLPLVPPIPIGEQGLSSETARYLEM